MASMSNNNTSYLGYLGLLGLLGSFVKWLDKKHDKLTGPLFNPSNPTNSNNSSNPSNPKNRPIRFLPAIFRQTRHFFHQ